MRSTLSWSDLPGRRVGLYGLGREGRANLRKCRQLGLDPLLVDDAPAAQEPAVLATDRGGAQALLGCDVVVKTPGISRYTNPTLRALASRGIPVVGGLGLWLREADRGRVLCVTGTKGKSSTVAIAGHLLRGMGHRCLVGGNFGASPYDPEYADAGHDYWIIEVSSYQATDVASSPPVVAVTSLHPDHLPWHGDDPETYYRDKLSLCSQPGADLTIANGDSDLLQARRDRLGPRVHWIRAADDPGASWMAPLGLLGVHNRRNALIARAGLEALGIEQASDPDVLWAAAAGFEHLESRLRPVGTAGGVLFVDDSLSTNVLPTLAAVDAFPGRRVALIAGGFSRGIDYQPLADGLRGRTPAILVLTVPDNGAQIGSVLRTAGVDAVDCADLATAVTRGHSWAAPDGVVLLSPAAASFGRFTDYRDRAAAFVSAMNTCAATVAPA